MSLTALRLNGCNTDKLSEAFMARRRMLNASPFFGYLRFDFKLLTTMAP